MPLEQWRAKVGRHLDKIGAAAAMCERHAVQLVARPYFDTMAEADLDAAERALLGALLKIHNAKEIIHGKEPAS